MRCLLRLKTTGWLQTSKPAGKEAQPPQRASGSRSKRQQRKQRCARYARVCVHVVSTASTLLPSSTQPSLTPPFTPCSSCSSGLFLFVLWLFVPSFFSNFFGCLGRLWFAEAKKASGSHAAVHVPSPRYPRFKGGWLLFFPLCSSIHVLSAAASAPITTLLTHSRTNVFTLLWAFALTRS